MALLSRPDSRLRLTGNRGNLVASPEPKPSRARRGSRNIRGRSCRIRSPSSAISPPAVPVSTAVNFHTAGPWTGDAASTPRGDRSLFLRRNPSRCLSGDGFSGGSARDGAEDDGHHPPLAKIPVGLFRGAPDAHESPGVHPHKSRRKGAHGTFGLPKPSRTTTGIPGVACPKASSMPTGECRRISWKG